MQPGDGQGLGRRCVWPSLSAAAQFSSRYAAAVTGAVGGSGEGRSRGRRGRWLVESGEGGERRQVRGSVEGGAVRRWAERRHGVARPPSQASGSRQAQVRNPSTPPRTPKNAPSMQVIAACPERGWDCASRRAREREAGGACGERYTALGGRCWSPCGARRRGPPRLSRRAMFLYTSLNAGALALGLAFARRVASGCGLSSVLRDADLSTGLLPAPPAGALLITTQIKRVNIRLAIHPQFAMRGSELR